MALGGKVDDAVDFVFGDYAAHLVEVGDVGLHEGVVGSVLDVLQVGEVAGVREFVEVDNTVVGIFVDEEAHHVAAYEACAAGYEYVAFHCAFRFVMHFLRESVQYGISRPNVCLNFVLSSTE